MELTLKRDDIRHMLSQVQNVVEKTSTMPILSTILLDATGGRATITATDLHTSIRGPLKCAVDKPGKICLPARKILEIVKEADEDILMQSDGEAWLKISFGKSNFKIACLPTKDYPAWPELGESVSLSLESKELTEMLEKTVYAAGDSDSRYTLNGVLFHVNPAKPSLTLVATDGHRCAIFGKQVQFSGDDLKVIVPKKAAAELRKFLGDDGTVEIRMGKNHALFRTADVEVLARLIEGTYPNYEQIIPRNNDKSITVDSEAMIKALKKTAIVSKEGSKSVIVEVGGNKIVCSAVHSELGEARDEVPVDCSGDAIVTGFNSGYLLEAISAFKTEKVTIRMAEKLSPVLITSSDNPNFLAIVMPVRS